MHEGTVRTIILSFFVAVVISDINRRNLDDQDISVGVDADSDLVLLQTKTVHFQRSVSAKIKKSTFWGNGPVALSLGNPCTKCSGYPNIIQITSLDVKSFTHHLTTLDTFVSIAAAVCARIQPPPPCEVLRKRFYGNMSREVQWQMYVNGTMGDGSPAFVMESRDCGTLMRTNTSANGTLHTELDLIGRTNSNCTSFVGIELPNSSFQDQFEAAVRARELVRPFKWRLDWNTIPKTLSDQEAISEVFHRRSAACNDYTLHPSNSILWDNKVIANTLLLRNGYTTVHVRRDESKHVCNTSVGNVVNYVHCSLKELSPEQLNTPIVYFTDKVDKEYSTKLKHELERSCNCSVYDGDALVSDMIPAVSDIYHGGRALALEIKILFRMEAKVELRMDGTHCQPCDSAFLKPACKGYINEYGSTSCSFFEYVGLERDRWTALAWNSLAFLNVSSDNEEPACLQQPVLPKALAQPKPKHRDDLGKTLEG